MADVHERPPGDSEYPSSINQRFDNLASSDSQNVPPVNESDARLKALLDQQARIQAEIKALLPPKNGVDTQQELVMLNHKHKMLKSCQEEHGLASVVLSVEEECRLLQYKCECLEASCLQSGKYISANDLLGKASLPLRSIQPSGFEDWLRTNARKYDPVLKHSPTGGDLRNSKVLSSHKCPEQKCIHYIYGFYDPESLEDHKQRQHLTSRGTMESLFSSASSYPPHKSVTTHQIGGRFNPRHEPLSERSLPASAAQYPSTASKDPGDGWESLADPSRQNTTQTSIDQPLPKAKTGCNNCKHRRIKCDETRPECNKCVRSGRLCDGYPKTKSSDTPSEVYAEASFSPPTWAKPLHAFPFVHEYPGYSDDHSDYQSSISSHPAKRLRLDADNQIETNLMKEVGPCLRCKILKKKCDTGDPCSLCPEQYNLARSDYWKVLGCHRGSLLSFREILVPDKLMPFHALESTESFKDFATHWWEQFQSEGGKISMDPTEMQDEFGLTWPVQIQDHPDARLEPLSSLIPPASILAREMNKHHPVGVGYTLMHLLQFSGTISGSTLAECQSYPLLAYSKSLLQEAIIFRASHDPIYRIGSQFAYDRYGILSVSCTNLLRSFDDTTQRRSTLSPRNWIAAFCSLCFLRAAVCFLDDGFDFLENVPIRRTSHSNAIHSVYKALVSNFSWAAPSLLDGETTQTGPDDKSLLSSLKEILLTDKWTEYGIPSARDFLIGLGSGALRDGSFKDFMLQRNFFLYPYTNSLSKDDHALTMSKPTIGGFEGIRQGYMPIEDSDIASVSQSTYPKLRPERVYCNQCENHPDGFRGEHELRRHQDREHKVLIKKWICVEPIGNHPQPQLPLSQCKACSVQKKRYGAYYNAAAHLRRTHFKPKAKGARKSSKVDGDKRGGKAGDDWPPMSELKHWMKEIEEPVDSSRIATEPAFEDDDDLFSTTESSTSLLYTNVVSQTSSPLFTSNSLDQMPGPFGSPLTQNTGPQLLTRQYEKPEKCPISTCEYHTKGFARIYDKNRHILSHYKGIIVCPFCPGMGTPKEKTFSRADVLKRHLSSFHNVEQAPPIMRMGSKSGTVSVPSGKKGKCSICSKEYQGAQVFYDHLNDCVLAVVAPAAHIGSAEAPRPASGAEKVQTVRD